jgi:multiple sugar transport system substrate-binding protein
LKTHGVVAASGAALLLLGSTSFASAQAVHRASHKPVTITLGGWSAFASNNVQSMEAFLKPFEKEYPWIHVVYRPVAGDYETVLKTEYVAGDAADVVALNNGGQASPFIDDGDVLPLNSFLASSHLSTSSFYGGTTSLFSYKGKLYAIPRDQDVLGLFYNTKMFAAAGIKSAPTTWAQLIADAKKLTNPKKHIYGIGIDPSEAYWAEFVYEAGGSIFNSSMTAPTLNTAAALKGFSTYVDLYRDGYAAQPTQVGATWSGQSFGIGRVAMTIEGGWLISSMSADWPKISYAVAPLPKGPVNADTVTFPVGWAISKTCKDPQAAWDLINYMTNTAQRTWVEETGALPTQTANLTMPFFTKNALWKPLISTLPVAQAWTFPNGFDEWSSTTLANQTLEAIEGQETAKQALADLQTTAEQTLQQSGG